MYRHRGIQVKFKHVPAHVDIHGNECADRLAKAAVRRAHRNANLTPSQIRAKSIDNMAEDIDSSWHYRKSIVDFPAL